MAYDRWKTKLHFMSTHTDGQHRHKNCGEGVILFGPKNCQFWSKSISFGALMQENFTAGISFFDSKFVSVTQLEILLFKKSRQF